MITIYYNIAEGLVSVMFGLQDGSMSLFGFGLDSFVEVVSGIGIWHMVRRIKQEGAEKPDRFEQRALRITGTAFFILMAGLILTSLVDIYGGHKPEDTFWGIIISIISILSMGLLLQLKGKIGRALNSSAILADAACSRACLQLSIVLLIASAGYKLTGIGGLDSIGAFVIGGLCYREGKEAFAKARVGSFACGCEGGCSSHERKKRDGSGKQQGSHFVWWKR
ncbi:MAG TPA: cation transporter [Nitrospirota bacterium]|nr:cation transporter [Nitrospirota bacterium]